MCCVVVSCVVVCCIVLCCVVLSCVDYGCPMLPYVFRSLVDNSPSRGFVSSCVRCLRQSKAHTLVAALVLFVLVFVFFFLVFDCHALSTLLLPLVLCRSVLVSMMLLVCYLSCVVV